jgi:hypothetical protein
MRESFRPGIHATAWAIAGCTANRSAASSGAVRPPIIARSRPHASRTPARWTRRLVAWCRNGAAPESIAAGMNERVISGR